jgi:hypothetical protein
VCKVESTGRLARNRPSSGLERTSSKQGNVSVGGKECLKSRVPLEQLNREI